jgi:hypothetical protein
VLLLLLFYGGCSTCTKSSIHTYIFYNNTHIHTYIHTYIHTTSGAASGASSTNATTTTTTTTGGGGQQVVNEVIEPDEPQPSLRPTRQSPLFKMGSGKGKKMKA